jgi:ATP-grasp domain-containing protein
LRRFAQWRDGAPGAVAPGAVAPGDAAPGTAAPGTAAPGAAAADVPGPHAEEQHPGVSTSDRALSYAEAKTLLSAAGVRVPLESFATGAGEAAEAADLIGTAVVMKLSAPGLIHKTEVGGVRVGIRGGAAAAAAFDELTSPGRLARFGLVADGVFVQEMLTEGLDLLVSAHGDEVFGPVLTIGAGGVDAEIDRDVAHLAIPFDDRELVQALRALRLWPHLAGFRGRPACDLDVLARAARGIADAYLSESSVAEIEVNPLRVVVTEEGTTCSALDIVALQGLAGAGVPGPGAPPGSGAPGPGVAPRPPAPARTRAPMRPPGPLGPRPGHSQVYPYR